MSDFVGWTTAGVAIGEIIGPFVGGPIYDFLGHWTAFVVVEGLLLLDVLLRVSVKEKEPETKETETQAQAQQDNISETDMLLPQGHTNAADYHHTTEDNGEAKEADSRKCDAGSLAWNWLGTVFALIIIFALRGALEVAS